MSEPKTEWKITLTIPGERWNELLQNLDMLERLSPVANDYTLVIRKALGIE